MSVLVISAVAGLGEASQDRPDGVAEQELGLVVSVGEVGAKFKHQAVKVAAGLVVVPANVTA